MEARGLEIQKLRLGLALREREREILRPKGLYRNIGGQGFKERETLGVSIFQRERHWGLQVYRERNRKTQVRGYGFRERLREEERDGEISGISGIEREND